jgi:hypothetical protein
VRRNEISTNERQDAVDRHAPPSQAEAFALSRPAAGGMSIVTGRVRVDAPGGNDSVATVWFTVRPRGASGEPLGAGLRCGPVIPNQSTSIRWRLPLPVGTVSLSIELDPPSAAYPIRWDKLRIRPESRVGRTLAAVSRAARLFWKSPTGLAADLDRLVAKKTLTGGLGGVAPDFVPQCRPLAARVDARLTGTVPVVNLLVPSLRREHLSGGPNTALNLAARLAQRGVPVRCLSTDWPMDDQPEWLDRHLRDLVGAESSPPNLTWHSAHDAGRPVSLGPNDVVLATAWWTAQQARPLLQAHAGLRLWYLVQDYEPGLYAWSTQAALAAETYSWPALPVYCGRLLRDHFAVERIGPFANLDSDDASHLLFEPAVDERLFHAGDRDRDSRTRRRFVFYARPSAPRNLYELGLIALRRAVDRGAFRGDWELWFMGENIPAVDLGHGVTIQPAPWADYAAYAAFLRETDVGLSLMLSPHPSYPPLELAACGATVVTNTFGVKTAERLAEISPQIMAVAPEIDPLAHALVTAAAGRLSNPVGQLGIDIPRDWQAAFEPVLNGLVNDWRGQVDIRRVA